MPSLIHALRATSSRDRIHAVLLLLITGGAVWHHCEFWHWFIEDAAISMAYAERLAEGDGLVAYAGGERVEGYSNPTWVALLALLHWLRIDVYEGTRWLQLLLCVLTVPTIYKATREIAGKDNELPLIAAAFVAASSQFAQWGASGLESGLLHFLVALALWLGFREWRTGSWPWSALVWFFVSITRPEAPLYAFVGGGLWIVFAMQRRQSLTPMFQWAFTLLAPFVGYHALRYWYFAWPFPNTYYAKLDHKENLLAEWGRFPWKWTRNFFRNVGFAYFLPLWVMAIAGHQGWRWLVVVGTTAGLGGAIALAGDQHAIVAVIFGSLWGLYWYGIRRGEQRPSPRVGLVSAGAVVALVVVLEVLRRSGTEPTMLPGSDLVATVTPVLVFAFAAFLPLFAIGQRAWQARWVCWFLCWTVVFFAVYAHGDWMKGFRWYAMPIVPASILFAFGVDSAARFVQDIVAQPTDRWTRWGYGTAIVLTLCVVPKNVLQTASVHDDQDPTPRGVNVRAKYVRSLMDRVHLDERVVDLDIDQGAHLLWSDFKMLDIAGLIDVPWGHHKFNKAFVREHVFQENQPHYAHVHGTWASRSRLKTFPEWKTMYVAAPHFPAGKKWMHVGNFVRRDLLFETEWTGSRHAPTTYGNGVTFHGWSVPSEPAKNGSMYVEIGLSAKKQKRDATGNARLTFFLANATDVFSWDLAPAYDWVERKDWRADEVFVGKYTLELPKDVSPGDYAVGVVMTNDQGRILRPVQTKAPTHDADTARFAAGEIRWPKALTILKPDKAKRSAQSDLDEALAHAKEAKCGLAKHSWWLARKHLAGNDGWADSNVDKFNTALARCWANRFDTASTEEERVRMLLNARAADPEHSSVAARAKAYGDLLFARGIEARVADDAESAYRAFADAVAVNPALSWARRYAEEARIERLGLNKTTKKGE